MEEHSTAQHSTTNLQYNTTQHTHFFIACAIQKAAMLFVRDACVQTILEEYLYIVSDAPFGVLPNRITVSHRFVVLKAGFMISRSERLCASPIEIIRVITAKQFLTMVCNFILFLLGAMID